MSTRSAQWIALAVVSVILVGAVVANQLKVHRGRQARAAVVEQRHALFELIQPVALANCRLERFGEPHDGGYLMCGNLLEQVQSGYSYGLHFNNASCADGIAPFPAWAYELLLVNKRLAVVDPSRKPMLPHPLDAPTDPSQPDCQAAGGDGQRRCGSCGPKLAAFRGSPLPACLASSGYG